MRTSPVSILLLSVALVCLAGFPASPSWAGELLEGAVRTAATEVGHISGDFSAKREGWKGAVGGDSDSERSFLVYDLADTGIRNEQGTIVMELERGEEFHREALFSLTDVSLERLFVLRIYWERGQGLPELNFYGGGITDFWFLRDPGNFDYPREGLPLSRPVARGEKLQIALTWGGGGQSRIHVNGRDLGAETTEGFRFPGIVAEAVKLLVGAETSPTRNPAGAWSMTSSPITSFKVFDRALTAEEIRNLNTTPIKEVTHDAFSVAGYSGKLVAGDTVTVRLQAGARGNASFEIVQPPYTDAGVDHPEKVKIPAVAMSEDPENPGTYAGSYTVKYGDDVAQGIVRGLFINSMEVPSQPRTASRAIDIDGRVHFEVKTSNDLLPADESSRSGLTVFARDANGKAVRGHELKLTMSTTNEYTGTVGGGTFKDLVGGELDVDWGGITDSFGEVTAQYISGFAAKTILVSAKDMVSGDVGVGWVRSFIDGTVDIVVTEPKASALAVAGSLDVSLSRDWLTADGRSRSRLTAVVKDASGKALSGHDIRFTLLGQNGEIRVVQAKTDSRGRALADYIAGIVMGQVQVEVRDLTSGMVVVVPIELRPDAPAEIILAADPGEVVTGGQSTVTAKVTDANGNPNASVDVLYNILAGEGSLGADKVATDEDGKALVTFTAGKAGIVTLRGTVMSREPTAEEISAAEGAVFLYGLSEDPGRLEVVEWLVEPGDEVVEGQALVTLEDRRDNVYTVVAPRDGVVATFVAEERDRVQYGDTLGYVIEKPE